MNGVKLFFKWFAVVFLCNLLSAILMLLSAALELWPFAFLGQALSSWSIFIGFGYLVVSYFRSEQKKKQEMGEVQYEIEKQKKRDARKLAVEKQAAVIGVLTGTATDGEREKLRRLRELEKHDRAQGGAARINGGQTKYVSGGTSDLSQYGIEDPDVKPGKSLSKIVVGIIVVVAILVLLGFAVVEVVWNSVPLFGG